MMSRKYTEKEAADQRIGGLAEYVKILDERQEAFEKETLSHLEALERRVVTISRPLDFDREESE